MVGVSLADVSLANQHVDGNQLARRILFAVHRDLRADCNRRGIDFFAVFEKFGFVRSMECQGLVLLGLDAKLVFVDFFQRSAE